MIVAILALAAGVNKPQAIPKYCQSPGAATASLVCGAYAQSNSEEVGEQILLTPEATKTFYKVADCTVRKAPAAVIRLLERSDLPRSKSFGVIAPKLSSVLSTCLGNVNGAKMRGDSHLYFGAWSQFLYRDNFSSLPQLDKQAIDLNHFADETPEQVGFAKWADCVVLKQPGAVDRLVRSEPATTDEAASIGDLKPVFASCLTEFGQLRTNVLNVRLGLADVLWRRASKAIPIRATK